MRCSGRNGRRLPCSGRDGHATLDGANVATIRRRCERAMTSFGALGGHNRLSTDPRVRPVAKLWLVRIA